MVGHLKELVTQLDAQVGAFELSEVTFELGFSAEGQLGFIAKAGATASVSVKFTKAASKVG